MKIQNIIFILIFISFIVCFVIFNIKRGNVVEEPVYVVAPVAKNKQGVRFSKRVNYTLYDQTSGKTLDSRYVKLVD